jgi:hypothetical protein
VLFVVEADVVVVGFVVVVAFVVVVVAFVVVVVAFVVVVVVGFVVVVVVFVAVQLLSVQEPFLFILLIIDFNALIFFTFLVVIFVRPHACSFLTTSFVFLQFVKLILL